MSATMLGRGRGLRSRHALAWVVAVVLPALVLAWGGWRFQRPPRPTGKAEAFDRRLQATAPEVLVLGSSLARTNVDLDKLSAELGVPRERVQMLTLPNATAAHWYAILENRVVRNGLSPRVVVMVGALTTMVTPDVLMDASVERLVNQLGADEPVIAAKVFRTSNPLHFRWLTMREQATALRDVLVSGWRDLLLASVWTRSGRVEDARRQADRANEIVFAAERMDYSLDAGSGTLLFDGAVERIDVSAVDVATESLLPDLAALGRDNGMAVVFVRTPFPPSNADNDFVPAAVEREAAEVIAAGGAGYLDLRSLNLDDRYFQDMRHMTREGAQLFTAALARALLEMGALDGKITVPSGLGQGGGLAAAELVRVGAPPPPLTAADGARDGCLLRFGAPWAVGLQPDALRQSGHPGASPLRVSVAGAAVAARAPGGCAAGHWFEPDALVVAAPEAADVVVSLAEDWPMRVEGEPLPLWWVLPGMAVEARFDEVWPYDPHAFRVFALGEAFGPGVFRLGVGDALEPADRVGRRVFRADSPVPPATATWTLRLEVPPDGGALLLQNLAVGLPPRTSHLIGLPELLTGASIRLVGGKVEDTHVEPEFAGPPPTIEQPTEIRRGPRGLGMMSLPTWAPVADAPHVRALLPNACSPLRVMEDGVPLPLHHSTCHDLAELKAGRSCHAGNVMYFAASDSSNPVTNGRTYGLQLDASRLCDRKNQADTTPLRGVIWIYPGDTVTLRFPPDRLAGFRDGANKLELELEALRAGPEDTLDISFTSGGRRVVDHVLEYPPGRRTFVPFVFEPPLPAATRDAVLELHNPSADAYWLLLLANLSEDYDYGFDPAAALAPDLEAVVAEVGAEALPRPARFDRLGAGPEVEVKTVRMLPQGFLEGRVFNLWPVSNTVLARQGLGWWSPVTVSLAGRALRPAVDRKAFRQSCDACFLHIGQNVFASADPGGSRELDVRLAAEVPMSGADGAPLVWIYPGTTLVVRPEVPFDGEVVELLATARAMTLERNEAWQPPRLRQGSRLASFSEVEGGDWVLKTSLLTQDAAEITLESPPGGPFVLLTALEARDASGAWALVTPLEVGLPEAEGDAGAEGAP